LNLEILDDQHEINISKVRDFLSPDQYSELKRISDDIMASNDPVFVDKRKFGRKLTVDPLILKQIQFEKHDVAETVFGVKLKPSFTILSMYHDEGNMYYHYDRDMCRYMINISVYSNCEWGLIVNDNVYNLNNNEAIFMSGTFHKHGREGTLDKGDLVYNAFIYYVEKDYDGDLW
jgi:hypothetical protein